MLSKIRDLKVYCDITESEFQSPSVITGDAERPDIVVVKERSCYLMELTVGFETNIKKNSERKRKKYGDLIKQLEKEYTVKYCDLSLGAIGVIGTESKNIQSTFEELGLMKDESSYLIRKIINVCLRTSYYIFCQRNKEWEAPSLLFW